MWRIILCTAVCEVVLFYSLPCRAGVTAEFSLGSSKAEFDDFEGLDCRHLGGFAAYDLAELGKGNVGLGLYGSSQKCDQGKTNDEMKGMAFGPVATWSIGFRDGKGAGAFTLGILNASYSSEGIAKGSVANAQGDAKYSGVGTLLGFFGAWEIGAGFGVGLGADFLYFKMNRDSISYDVSGFVPDKAGEKKQSLLLVTPIFGILAVL